MTKVKERVYLNVLCCRKGVMDAGVKTCVSIPSCVNRSIQTEVSQLREAKTRIHVQRNISGELLA